MQPFFESTYIEARDRFLRAANGCDAKIIQRQLFLKNSSDIKLSVDIAQIGAPTAKKVLVIISGTHGIEGYCGSACQTAWLETAYQSDERDIAIYLIHGLNPYGFAFHRRVTEGNVDLNRNFVDFSCPPLPTNTEYMPLEPLLNPRVLNKDTIGKLDPNLTKWFATPEKTIEFKAAVGQGQYDFPKGIIFGGREPSWSNTVLREFIQELPTDLEVGVVLDFHTGLGHPGELEIFTEERYAKFGRIQKLFANNIVTTLGDPVGLGYVISGSLYRAFTEPNSTSPWHCVALEFGTRSLPQVLLALQADNWLHCFESQPNSLSGQVVDMMKDAFFVPVDFRERVVTNAVSVIERALQGINQFQG